MAERPEFHFPAAALLLDESGTIVNCCARGMELFNVTSSDLQHGTRTLEPHLGRLWFHLGSDSGPCLQENFHTAVEMERVDPNAVTLGTHIDADDSISEELGKQSTKERFRSPVKGKISLSLKNRENKPNFPETGCEDKAIGSLQLETVSQKIAGPLMGDQPSPDYVVIDLKTNKTIEDDSNASLVEYYVENKDVLGLPFKQFPYESKTMFNGSPLVSHSVVHPCNSFPDSCQLLPSPLCSRVVRASGGLIDNRCKCRDFLVEFVSSDLQCIAHMWVQSVASRKEECKQQGRNALFFAVLQPVPFSAEWVTVNSSGFITNTSENFHRLFSVGQSSNPNLDNCREVQRASGMPSTSLQGVPLLQLLPQLPAPRSWQAQQEGLSDERSHSPAMPLFGCMERLPAPREEHNQLQGQQQDSSTQRPAMIQILGANYFKGCITTCSRGFVRYCSPVFAASFLRYRNEEPLLGQHISLILPSLTDGVLSRFWGADMKMDSGTISSSDSEYCEPSSYNEKDLTIFSEDEMGTVTSESFSEFIPRSPQHTANASAARRSSQDEESLGCSEKIECVDFAYVRGGVPMGVHNPAFEYPMEDPRRDGQTRPHNTLRNDHKMQVPSLFRHQLVTSVNSRSDLDNSLTDSSDELVISESSMRELQRPENSSRKWDSDEPKALCWRRSPAYRSCSCVLADGSVVDAVFSVTSLEVLGERCYNVWLEVPDAAHRAEGASSLQSEARASRAAALQTSYEGNTKSFHHPSLFGKGGDAYDSEGGNDAGSEETEDSPHCVSFSSYDVNSVTSHDDNSVSPDIWLGNIPVPVAFSQDIDGEDMNSVHAFVHNDGSHSPDNDSLSQGGDCLSLSANSFSNNGSSYSRSDHSYSKNSNSLNEEYNQFFHDLSPNFRDDEHHSLVVNPYSHSKYRYSLDTDSHSQDTSLHSQEANSSSQDIDPHSPDVSSHSQDARPYFQDAKPYLQNPSSHLRSTNPYTQNVNSYPQNTDPLLKSVNTHWQNTDPRSSDANTCRQDTSPYHQSSNPYQQDTDHHFRDSNQYLQRSKPLSQDANLSSRGTMINVSDQDSTTSNIHTESDRDDFTPATYDDQNVEINHYRFSSHTDDHSSSTMDATTTTGAEDDSEITSSGNTKNSSEEDVGEEVLSTDEISTVSSGSSGDDYTIQEVCRPYQGHACPLGRRQGPRLGEVCAAVAGIYSRHYGLLHEIGRGAFGSVRLSYRKKDGLLAVTKLIPKSCVGRGNWATVSGKRVPLEVAILTSLDHPNVVSVLDVFDNRDYVQLVMEKFGAGLDLFEFIERDPVLDDPLAAYIFAQLVSALLYLRSVGVLHRDVKDENVIINERFSIKLIDFGSATYTRKENHLFSQFAGTVEYCSPEVLLGNKYLGPELEVWSVGVTLYTLMVGENPFHNVEQTIHHNPRIPGHLSEGVTDLITAMLCKDPKSRYTLDQVAQHHWTRQPCDPSRYNFSEVVPSSEEECHPIEYVNSLDVEELYLDDEDCILTTTSDSFTYRPHTEASHRHALSVGCAPLSLYGSPVKPCAHLQHGGRGQEDQLLDGRQPELEQANSGSPSTLSSDSDISQSSGDDVHSAVLQGSCDGQVNCTVDRCEDGFSTMSAVSSDWSEASESTSSGGQESLKSGSRSSLKNSVKTSGKGVAKIEKLIVYEQRKSVKHSSDSSRDTSHEITGSSPLSSQELRRDAKIRGPAYQLGAGRDSQARDSLGDIDKDSNSSKESRFNDRSEDLVRKKINFPSSFSPTKNVVTPLASQTAMFATDTSAKIYQNVRTPGCSDDFRDDSRFVRRKTGNKKRIRQFHARNNRNEGRVGHRRSRSKNFQQDQACVKTELREPIISEHVSNSNDTEASESRSNVRETNDHFHEEMDASKNMTANLSDTGNDNSDSDRRDQNDLEGAYCEEDTSESFSDSSNTFDNSNEIATVKRVSTPDLQYIMTDDDCGDNKEVGRTLLSRSDPGPSLGTKPTVAIAAQSVTNTWPLTISGDASSTIFNSQSLPVPLRLEKASSLSTQHKVIHLKSSQINVSSFASQHGDSGPEPNFQLGPYSGRQPTMPSYSLTSSHSLPFRNLSYSALDSDVAGRYFSLDHASKKSKPYIIDESVSMNRASKPELSSDNYYPGLGRFKSYSSECITENYDENGLVSVEHHPEFSIGDSDLNRFLQNSDAGNYSTVPKDSDNNGSLDVCVGSFSDIRTLDEVEDDSSLTRSYNDFNELTNSDSNMTNSDSVLHVDNPNFVLYNAEQIMKQKRALSSDTNSSAKLEEKIFVSSSERLEQDSLGYSNLKRIEERLNEKAVTSSNEMAPLCTANSNVDIPVNLVSSKETHVKFDRGQQLPRNFAEECGHDATNISYGWDFKKKNETLPSFHSSLGHVSTSSPGTSSQSLSNANRYPRFDETQANAAILRHQHEQSIASNNSESFSNPSPRPFSQIIYPENRSLNDVFADFRFSKKFSRDHPWNDHQGASSRHVPDLIAMTKLLGEMGATHKRVEKNLEPLQWSFSDAEAAGGYHTLPRKLKSNNGRAQESLIGNSFSEELGNNYTRKSSSAPNSSEIVYVAKENGADVAFKQKVQRTQNQPSQQLSSLINALLPEGDLLHPDDVKWLYRNELPVTDRSVYAVTKFSGRDIKSDRSQTFRTTDTKFAGFRDYLRSRASNPVQLSSSSSTDIVNLSDQLQMSNKNSSLSRESSPGSMTSMRRYSASSLQSLPAPAEATKLPPEMSLLPTDGLSGKVKTRKLKFFSDPRNNKFTEPDVDLTSKKLPEEISSFDPSDLIQYALQQQCPVHKDKTSHAIDFSKFFRDSQEVANYRSLEDRPSYSVPRTVSNTYTKKMEENLYSSPQKVDRSNRQLKNSLQTYAPTDRQESSPAYCSKSAAHVYQQPLAVVHNNEQYMRSDIFSTEKTDYRNNAHRREDGTTNDQGTADRAGVYKAGTPSQRASFHCLAHPTMTPDKSSHSTAQYQETPTKKYELQQKSSLGTENRPSVSTYSSTRGSHGGHVNFAKETLICGSTSNSSRSNCFSKPSALTKGVTEAVIHSYSQALPEKKYGIYSENPNNQHRISSTSSEAKARMLRPTQPSQI